MAKDLCWEGYTVEICHPEELAGGPWSKALGLTHASHQLLVFPMDLPTSTEQVQVKGPLLPDVGHRAVSGLSNVDICRYMDFIKNKNSSQLIHRTTR